MTNLKERNIVIIILLHFVTCGIYGIYLFFAFGSELKAEAEKNDVQQNLASPIVALLLSIVTCGIYGIIYIYFQANALEQIGEKKDVVTNPPVVVLILTIFVGIGTFFNYHSANLLVRSGK